MTASSREVLIDQARAALLIIDFGRSHHQ